MPPNEPVTNPEATEASSPGAEKSDVVAENATETPEQKKPRSPARAGKSKAKKSGSPISSLAITVGVALCVALVTFGATKLLQLARAYVAEQDRFQANLHDIELTPPPAWVRGDMVAEVQRLAALPDSLHTLDPNLARDLRDAFGLHPWVREVVEVRIMLPSRIRVKLEYREPIAAVHTTRSVQAVDRDGILLPDIELTDSQTYLTVTGVRSTPSGPAGTKWDDPTLAAGIAVAAALAPHYRTLAITTIDVSGFRADGSGSTSIFLLTERGTRVKWGRPPDTDNPGEVPVADKLDRLTNYVAEHGSLDDPAGPYDMDITHWQEISLRPRNQAPSRR